MAEYSGLVRGMERVTRELQTLGNAVRGLAERMDEPTRILRGRDGRAVGVQRNGTVQQIVRDGEGRAIGAVPIGEQLR